MAVKPAIDLNADLGEDESEQGTARDLAIMDVISSCNIACGGHAGSPESMERMLLSAKEKSVVAGAHPAYPDRENFGRKTIDISLTGLRNSLQKQLNAIKAAADKTGAQLHHLKPHGALYNDAQDNEALAEVLVALAKSEKLALVGMAQSVIHKIADQNNVPFITEGFIDRRYDANARLVPRGEQGAVIELVQNRLNQGLALAKGEQIFSGEGEPVSISAQTLCLHSDSEGALSTAQAMRQTLEHSGFVIQSANI